MTAPRPDHRRPGTGGATPEGALERDLALAEQEIEELRRISAVGKVDLASQIATLETRAEELREAIARNPSPWQTVQLARHAERPKVADYISGLATDFIELHGDRTFRDDPAIVAGLGMVDGRPAAIIGHAKGRDTRENIARNFGMPNPEGYRKAVRVMKLAAKLKAPVITLIDTQGAYPGKEAEERGQSEAIARSLLEMGRLRTPIVTVITGEGGSGGALAIGMGDSLLMLEHAVYSVISPEGCAAILWRDGTRGREAAEALKMTARDLAASGIADEVIPEPPGGAHRHPQEAVEAVAAAVRRHLARLGGMPTDTLLEARYEKFRRIGRLRDMGETHRTADTAPGAARPEDTGGRVG